MHSDCSCCAMFDLPKVSGLGWQLLFLWHSHEYHFIAKSDGKHTIRICLFCKHQKKGPGITPQGSLPVEGWAAGHESIDSSSQYCTQHLTTPPRHVAEEAKFLRHFTQDSVAWLPHWRTLQSRTTKQPLHKHDLTMIVDFIVFGI